jgi:hypothetical protein
MGWKNRIAYHYQIKNIGHFTIKVIKDTHDDIVTKTSINEYQVDTYYHNTNILINTHIENSIKSYLNS